jgi:hypothetical protein
MAKTTRGHFVTGFGGLFWGCERCMTIARIEIFYWIRQPLSGYSEKVFCIWASLTCH